MIVADAERQAAKQEALAEARRFKLPEAWQEGRERVEGITIDAQSTLDRDDAIWFLPREDGGHTVQVSIADTGSFLPLNSAMAAYAEAMGETRYFAGRNDPMLPRKVSENVLSLLDHKETPSLTMTIGLDASGQPDGFSIAKTRIKPFRITYPQVAELTHSDGNDSLAEVFRAYESFALQLLDNRRDRGAFAYYNPDQGIMTDEDGQLVNVHKGVAHSGELIVQEFMILANASLANFMHENNIPGLFRNHTLPQQFDVRELSDLVASGEIEVVQAVRSRMGRAHYATSARGHDALQLPAYLHSTSPLRRFADMVNHANLNAFLNNEPYPFEGERLDVIAEHLNDVRRILREGTDRKLHAERMKLHLQRLGATATRLAVLEPGFFSKVVDAAAETGDLRPGLIEALDAKIEAGNVRLGDLVTLLFSTADNERVQAYRSKIAEVLSASPGQAVMALHNAVQAEILLAEYATQGDSVTVTVLWNGGIYEASSSHSRNKTAQQRAAAGVIAKIAGNPEQTYDTEDESRPDEAAVVPEARGALETYCLRNGIAVPTLETREVWTNGSDYLFESTITVAGQQFTGQGMRRKVAEATAATNAARELGVLGSIDRKRASSANAISKLNERSARLRLPMPSFAVRRAGPPHQPTFECTIMVANAEGKMQEFTAEGQGRSQDIKAEAAQKALDAFGE